MTEADAVTELAREGATPVRRRRGRPKKVFVLGQNETTYDDMGISRKDAWIARQYASIPADELEAALEAPATQGELLRLAARYTAAACDDKRIKIRSDDPARAAWSIASQCPAGFVEELIALLGEYLQQYARRRA